MTNVKNIRVCQVLHGIVRDRFAPLVSIVVPVYNAAQTLEKCVGSLISQTFGDVEILLVNNGSTDNSLDVCNRIAAKLLVPEDLFHKEWQKCAHDFEQLEKFFKVSQLVLFRAALTYNKINKREYARLVRLYESKYNSVSNASGGGDFYNIAPYRAGRGFCRYIDEAIHTGDVTYTEAYSLLGIRGKAFAEVMKRAKEVSS